jgi:oxygen-dependent protoporphyrinogen oxidase
LNGARIVVAGAGIAGLACATELVARGCDDVVVLEAEPRAGGPAETVRIGGYLVERGPNTVRANPELLALIERAGLAPVEARRASPAFVADGEVVVLPPSPRALLAGRVLPVAALLGVLAEPLRPVGRAPRTVRQLVEERFGAAVAERLADLMTLGVYGTSAERIGFEAAFPELAARLAAAGGRFTGLVLRSLRGSGAARPRVISTELGLGGLCQRLAERLGARLRTRSALRRARKTRAGFELELDSGAKLDCERLVLALPPAAAARVLELPDTALLEDYPTQPQVLASFALEDAACAERWPLLGILAPQRERLPFIGCLMPGNLFPGRAAAGALLLSVFAASGLHGASDAALAREIAPALMRLLGAAREPTLLDVARWPAGIPLYDVGHPERTRALRERLRAWGGPLLCGMSYDGVAFAAAAASGAAAARQLLDD